MCFAKQPDPPIQTPSYAPDDAYKHFDSTVQEGDGPKRKINPATDPATSPATGPKIKRLNETIRM